MKPHPMCLTCTQLYCCTLTRTTDQCPIIVKPANEPFDKEQKTEPFQPTWDSLEGRYE